MRVAQLERAVQEMHALLERPHVDEQVRERAERMMQERREAGPPGAPGGMGPRRGMGPPPGSAPPRPPRAEGWAGPDELHRDAVRALREAAARAELTEDQRRAVEKAADILRQAHAGRDAGPPQERRGDAGAEDVKRQFADQMEQMKREMNEMREALKRSKAEIEALRAKLGQGKEPEKK
jgi:hypothetical protein